MGTPLAGRRPPHPTRPRDPGRPTPGPPDHGPRDRRVVHGHRLPDDRPALSANERAWVGLLRAIAGDRDPPPSLAAVQALRRALGTREEDARAEDAHAGE